MYLYLTCSISCGVNLYLDLLNVNKVKFEFKGMHVVCFCFLNNLLILLSPCHQTGNTGLTVMF
jgi:hypothetical protein